MKTQINLNKHSICLYLQHTCSLNGEYQMKYQMKFVILLLFAAMLIIPVSASNPEMITWYNDKTNNDTKDLTIYIRNSQAQCYC